MSLNEIEMLLKKIIEDEFISDKEKKSVSSKIKRLYKIKKQELKSNGKNFSHQSINKLINMLVENYDKFKDNDIINEVMQEMAEDYSQMKPTKNVTKESIDKKVKIIYQNILGNPGTNTNEMSSEFISDIIRLKLTEDEGINREDILNILKMQSKNMYQDVEKYQKLIEDTVISYISYNPTAQSFTNPKILEILGNLANSYKVSENFDRAKEIYEQALKMKCLQDKPEYQELKTHYEGFSKFLEMKKSFEYRKYDSFEELMESLEVNFTDKRMFKKGRRNLPPRLNDIAPSEKTNTKGYIMPVELKIEGLKGLVRNLKKSNEDIDITSCEVGKYSYNGYVIFKLDGTNVSILEYFGDKKEHARLYIIKNELIEIVRELTKNDAIAMDGVERINHIKDYNSYLKNMKEKTLKLIKETSPRKEQEDLEAKFEYDKLHKDSSIPTDSDEVREISNSNENITEDVVTENDAKEENSEIEIIDEIEETDEIEKNDEEQETDEIKGNNGKEENEPVDELMEERKKAHANREYIRKLEEEIDRIKREAEEKIAKIKEENGRQYSNRLAIKNRRNYSMFNKLKKFIMSVLHPQKKLNEGLKNEGETNNFIETLQKNTQDFSNKKVILAEIDKDPSLIDKLPYSRLVQLNRLYAERIKELEMQKKILMNNK